ncbi:6ecc5a11-14c6-4405-93b9-d2a8fe7f6783 [Thermothielavioides terrestris]|jgi:ADP-ribose pyrophosphatase YjhB (NUDIX family)|uniref:6ecc5a11-14c6-4405-93b9-d2a8fe7f6783 n=1 Tax=Thermothielavioides terrestris TaxID=2587410 RepID=A0A446BUQ6_9PEZI|nr:6ecc5a11-14c6-4405-93b9-d2a8fe7f6783 [Thermothielavioides terrestris]
MAGGTPGLPVPKVIGSAKPNVSYTHRVSVRAVAFNDKGEIAILYASKEDYYKLPGGGIEPGEDHETALKREFREETGGLIKLRGNGCIGATEEFRGHLRQVSYCYCADLVDGSGEPALTEEEIEDGLGHLWVSVEEAKRLMSAAEPTSDFGRSVKQRDIYLLNEATKADAR